MDKKPDRKISSRQMACSLADLIDRNSTRKANLGHLVFRLNESGNGYTVSRPLPDNASQNVAYSRHRWRLCAIDCLWKAKPAISGFVLWVRERASVDGVRISIGDQSYREFNDCSYCGKLALKYSRSRPAAQKLLRCRETTRAREAVNCDRVSDGLAIMKHEPTLEERIKKLHETKCDAVVAKYVDERARRCTGVPGLAY